MSTIAPLSPIQNVTSVAPVAWPTLKVGAVVDALVLQMMANGTAKIATVGGQLEGKSEAVLIPGSLVRLEVTAPGQLRLVATLATAGAGTPGTTGAPAAPDTSQLDTARLQSAATASAPQAQRQPQPQPTPAEAQAAAVATATSQAAGQQRSLAPLLAELAALVARPDSPLPAPVRAAAVAVLALPLDAEGLDAKTLRDAFTQSGLFRESRIVATLGAPAGSAPARDLKSALLALRDTLQGWRAGISVSEAAPTTTSTATPLVAGEAVPAAPRATGEALARSVAQLLQAAAADPRLDLRLLAPLVSPGAQRALLEALAKELPALPPVADAAVATPETVDAIRPPPYRHGPLSPQPAAESALALDAAPDEIATRLLAATEGALARHTLTQIASLPDAYAPETRNGERLQASWTFELPLRTPEGTAVVPFEIARDGSQGGSGEPEHAPSWQARFSADLPAAGPVHAQVTLTGDSAAVTLWAEHNDTAAALQGGISILEAALREAGLEPGALRILLGAPRAVSVGPGKFLDQAT